VKAIVGEAGIPALVLFGVPFQQENAQRVFRQSMIGQFAEPIGQGFGEERGIIGDDQSWFLPGPTGEVLSFEKALGFLGGEKAALPMAGKILE
jgi:hypothetical protein